MSQRQRLCQEHLNGASKFEVVSHCQLAHDCAAYLGASMQIVFLELDFTFLFRLQSLSEMRQKITYLGGWTKDRILK
jgi:hypothetical protein